MPPDLMAPAPSAVVAAASTVNVALALLRRHRSWPRRFSPYAIPGFLFAVVTWIFPSPVGLGSLLVAHLVWFAACEKAFPAPAPLKPGWFETKVIGIVDQTSDIRTFRLRRLKGFDFKPGQFLAVQIPVGGTPFVRCYSICSAPESKRVLEISVKKQGLVSGALHETLRPGSWIQVRKPAGPFVYPADDPRPMVLLAGGVGITPLLSMLRHAAVAEPGRRATLVVSVKTEDDVPFREELRSFDRHHRNAHVVIAVTRGCPKPGLHTGRVDGDLLRRITGDPTSAIYCICGPSPMIDGMKSLLASLGVPAGQVRAEAFEAAVASVSTPLGAKEPVNLTLTKTGQTLRVRPGRTVLEAAEMGGAEIPSSCRAGVCRSCRTKVVSGVVECEAPALDVQDRDGGYTYPCVAWAKTHCAIEA
ncbi:MAG: 2Fe-2S iron-sulfur cluster-binding protein [Thermoanaerobaculia bacterium]